MLTVFEQSRGFLFVAEPKWASASTGKNNQQYLPTLNIKQSAILSNTEH